MPEWRSKWMDYKALKTILKSIPLKPESVGPDELANQLCTFPTLCVTGRRCSFKS